MVPVEDVLGVPGKFGEKSGHPPQLVIAIDSVASSTSELHSAEGVEAKPLITPSAHKPQ